MDGTKTIRSFLLKIPEYSHFLLLFGFLFLFTLNHNGDFYYAQRAGSLFFVCALVAVSFGRRYGFLVGCFFAYYLFSALSITVWMDNIYVPFWQDQGLVQPNHPKLELAEQALRHELHRVIFFGVCSTLLIWIAVGQEVLRQRKFAELFLWFGFVCAFHHWFLSGVLFSDGFLMTPSLASVFLVLLIPLAMKTDKMHLWWIIPTVLKMGGLTGYLSLIAVGWAYFAVWDGFLGFLSASVVSALSFIWFYWGFAESFLASRRDKGRIEVWVMAYQWFQEIGHTWFGMGPGSSYFLIPIGQQLKHVGLPYLYTHLHNDVLQSLFDLGWVGIALVAVIYIRSLYRTYRYDVHSFAFLIALIPGCLTMFPFRHETFLLLIVFYLHNIFTSQYPKQMEIL